MDFFKKASPSKTTSPPKNKASSTAATARDNIQIDVYEKVLQQDGVQTAADLVGSIDQGTSSTRFLLFTAAGHIAASAQMEHTQIFPSAEVRTFVSDEFSAECSAAYESRDFYRNTIVVPYGTVYCS
jgi:hypothetical protein